MLYVLASFKKEINYLLDIVEIIDKKRTGKKVYYRCKLNDKEFHIVKSGLGKKSILMDFNQFSDCSMIVSTGFCGALATDFKNGDIIISNQIITTADNEAYNLMIKGKEIGDKDLRFEIFGLDQEMIGEYIKVLSEDNLKVRFVKTFTSPRIVRNKAQRRSLNKITGAETVDMEDIFRFDFAKKIGADFLSVRVVLDEISDDIPGFSDGFKMGQKLTGIISKMDRAAQSIAVALERYIKMMK